MYISVVPIQFVKCLTSASSETLPISCLFRLIVLVKQDQWLWQQHNRHLPRIVWTSLVEMSTANGHWLLNKYTLSETQIPAIAHRSYSICTIIFWFFIQLSATLRILSTWAHRVKCHVPYLPFLHESWKWNTGTSENKPCFVPGGVAWKLYFFIPF